MSQELDQLAASFGDNDAQVDLSDTLPEAWLALLLFFSLGLTVFYQFITRYVCSTTRPLGPKKWLAIC